MSSEKEHWAPKVFARLQEEDRENFEYIRRSMCPMKPEAIGTTDVVKFALQYTRKALEAEQSNKSG